MSRILITGGTGYIGSHTVVALQQAGFEAVIVDNLSNSSEKVLDGIESITGQRPIFFKTDCADLEAFDAVLGQAGRLDAVIHFAAFKAVGESVEQPLRYYRNNINSTLNVLALMKKYHIPHLVFSSSCTVYGQPSQLPVTEQAPMQPATSPYGYTKQVCETIIRDSANAEKGIQAVLLRYFNPIGAHQSAQIGELPNGVPNNLIPYITQTAIGIRPVLRVFGNNYNTPDGSCIRDFINVNDLAQAHLAALRYLQSGRCTEPTDVFNIGTGNGCSVLQLINSFQKVCGVELPWQIAPRREGDIEQVWADATKANQVLGWQATHSLDETLLSAWNWEKHLKESKQ